MNNLVDYSSSENDTEKEIVNTEKQSSLYLPLPLILNKKEILDENQQDHEGRTRSISHERGNWASYIYIIFPTNDSIESLQKDLINYSSTNYLVEELKPFADNFHISLTRLVILKHHWIDSFSDTIRQLTEGTKKFSVQLNELELYCNDEKTRTFVGIKVFEEDVNFLESLVKKYDECLESYNLQKYYQPPSFHISILWCLGDKRANLRAGLNRFNEILQTYLDDDIQDFTENVKNISFKCGNRIYNYGLE